MRSLTSASAASRSCSVGEPGVAVVLRDIVPDWRQNVGGKGLSWGCEKAAATRAVGGKGQPRSCVEL